MISRFVTEQLKEELSKKIAVDTDSLSGAQTLAYEDIFIVLKNALTFPM